MTHDKEKMLMEILVPLALHYPQAGHTPAQLSVLADDWCEDLADYPMPVLAEAARKARKQKRFFPPVAVMIEYGNSALAEKKGTVLALPELPSPERMRAQGIYAAMLAASLAGNASAKAFFETQDREEQLRLVCEVLGDNYTPTRGEGARRVLQ